MECFIKKVWQGKGEEAHNCFVRFSKGRFENRAVLNLQKSAKIKLRGSFEWANDFVKVASELGEAKFSGIILSKEELKELEIIGKWKKELIEYNLELHSEKIKQIRDKVYCMMLDAESSEFSLKMKKKLPKPGKSGTGKIDDKFCVLEADLKFWPQIKEAFMLPECKKCKISHTFLIEEIILPKDEKDFAKIREMAKRKGKIIRKMEVDGKESQEEKSFEA